MKICPQLLAWQFWRLRMVTVLGVAVAFDGALFVPTPLYNGSAVGAVVLFIVAHGLLCAALLGRVGAGEVGFLYGLGHGRDALWSQTLLAALASFLVCWLAAALVVWSGARSWVQDHVMQSPDYPLMAPLETTLPLIWLGGYLLIFPVAHYAWIRGAQPVRAPDAGKWLLLAWLATALFLFGSVAIDSRSLAVPRVTMIVALGVVAVVLLLAGRKLHRQLEIRS